MEALARTLSCNKALTLNNLMVKKFDSKPFTTDSNPICGDVHVITKHTQPIYASENETGVYHTLLLFPAGVNLRSYDGF